ncbi:MAG: HAD family hydrolase [Solirubrobacteraceae bacterium]
MSDPARAIEAVVFDIGGVLLDWDPRYLYRKLFDDEEAMNRFLEQVCTVEWHERHDRGCSVTESCEKLATARPEEAELIRAWGRRSEEMVAGPIDGTVQILQELRDAGVACYALTNMERESYPRRVARYPFLNWFDGTVVSGFEGVIKPDPEIFELLMRRFDLSPSSTLLIDDSYANVEAALSLGMRGLRFRSPTQLRTELERLRLLSPTASR